MSYRPSGSGGGYQPPVGPGSYNVSGVKVRRKKNGGVPWFLGCGLLVFGMLIGVAGLLLFALFWFGTPVTNQPLPRPDFKGTADVAATVSEAYLNVTTSQFVNEKPISLGGLANVKDIVLRVLPNQRIETTLRGGNNLVDFDIIVTEAIGLRDGKIVLNPVGQPKVGKGDLPAGSDKLVELANTTIIEPQINQNLAQLKFNNRTFKLVDVTTTQGLITVKFNAQ